MVESLTSTNNLTTSANMLVITHTTAACFSDCHQIGSATLKSRTTRMHHLNLTLIVPLGIRFLALVAGPCFHFAFHRVGEKVIHLGVNHLPGLTHLSKIIRFFPDLLMIAVLIVLHVCTEGEGHIQE